MQRRCYGYTLLALIATGLLPLVWADTSTESADRDRRIQQLYESAFGPEEGARRYQEWQRTKDLPLDQYIAQPPVTTDTPATTDAAPAEPTAAPATPPPTDVTASHAAPSTDVPATAEPTAPVIAAVDMPPATVAAAVPVAEMATQTSSAQKEYYLTMNDSLKVSVWQWPDLRDDDIIIRPDGKFSFPLVGDLQAAGLTITEVDAALTTALSRYIREPQVSVTIRTFGGHKIVVLGEVVTPSVYLMGDIRTAGGNVRHGAGQETTLLEAISLAGGFTPAAKLKNIVILRKGADGRPDIQLVNIYDTMRGKATDLSANINLRPNDIVFVPKTLMTDIKEVANTVIPFINAAFQTVIGYDQITRLNDTTTN